MLDPTVTWRFSGDVMPEGSRLIGADPNQNTLYGTTVITVLP